MTQTELYTALSGYGFTQSDRFCCGVWRGYAVSVWPYGGNNYYGSVAVRLEKPSMKLRKELNAALKQPGSKVCSVGQVQKKYILFTINFGKTENPGQLFTEQMEKLTGALYANGIHPADTCAISGTGRPDSLCIVNGRDCIGLQPVQAAVVRQQSAQTQEKTEENENSGSYVTGLIGAVLGMLVGVLANLLTILLLDRVIAIVFALVPLASMFGYKLFKGKLSKGAIVIVLVLCVFAVLLMPYLELVYYVVHDYGVSLAEALPACSQLYAENFSELLGELGQLTLFMVLGVFIAWRYLFGQLNSNQLGVSQTRLESLRPNPNYQMQYTQTSDPV